MPTGLLHKLISMGRRVAFYLREKPALIIDDHVLEHMLFYHGLSGTSPENEKLTKMVKADIKEAIARKSSSELSLALKLTPTLWEERLKNIIAELETNEQQLLINLLLPLELSPNSCFENEPFAVVHQDWQVRANAANILGFLKAKEAIPALAKGLDSDITGGALSFCYIAYALGKLRGEEARKALEAQLLNSDPWLRIDAAGALSYFEFEIVSESLAKALLQEQEALDYMAYAISRRHKPQKFLSTNSAHIVKAGGQLISGIMAAAESSFNRDLVIETESHLCLVDLIALAQNEANPLLVDTSIDLCNWLLAHKENLDETNINWSSLKLEEQKNVLSKITSGESLKNNILTILKKTTTNLNTIEAAELMHAIKLAGNLNLAESQSLLIDLLNKYKSDLSFSEIKYVITALSQLSNDSDHISSLLIDYIKELVNIDERCELTKSKQPVFEENSSEAKIYWQILKTLANLPTTKSVAFLFQALNDYAPDKRACALESLTMIYEKNPSIKLPKLIDQILQDALRDPAPMMQLAALVSIARLNRASLIEDLIPLVDAHENTISKEALFCLDHIAKDSGHAVNIKALLKEKYKTLKEEHKRKRIMDILQK